MPDEAFVKGLADRLNDAAACAENRDIDGAISYARLALEEWEQAGHPENSDASQPPSPPASTEESK